MKVLSLALIVIACWVVSPAYASPDGSLEDTPLVDAVKTAKAQPKIASLLDQLRAIKDEADFHEKGFDDYRRAKVWLLSVEILRYFMSGQTEKTPLTASTAAFSPSISLVYPEITLVDFFFEKREFGRLPNKKPRRSGA